MEDYYPAVNILYAGEKKISPRYPIIDRIAGAKKENMYAVSA